MGALPGLLGKTLFKRFYEKMGTVRFFVGVNLFLIMFAVPIKMYLRKCSRPRSWKSEFEVERGIESNNSVFFFREYTCLC